MDPYCRLRVGHAVFETQTKLSGGRSPVWNRTVHAYLPNGVESIYIQIFDEFEKVIPITSALYSSIFFDFLSVVLFNWGC
ncbi:hypothetical protein ANCCAN_25470 [Ancylostoma caninum]|uniref:C2 domain-containing protein n=1 Tax=Ancylostoma caninum TaxID=29170 RepID=A0A368F9F8_ANCCA|nr:hypothetical protein ANCCAN_25470 [Ancylostoma caninum]